MPDLGFHQGQITYFNSGTGENEILIAGSVITNVPMLNIGDTVNLVSGDLVAVLRHRSTYFILGRIVLPLSEFFASSSVAFATRHTTPFGFAISTTEFIAATATMTVPAWSERVLCWADIHCTGINSGPSTDLLYGAVWIDTHNGSQSVVSVPAGLVGEVNASHSVTMVVTPGGSFDVTGRMETDNTTWTAGGFNQCMLTVSAIYRREAF